MKEKDDHVPPPPFAVAAKNKRVCVKGAKAGEGACRCLQGQHVEQAREVFREGREWCCRR